MGKTTQTSGTEPSEGKDLKRGLSSLHIQMISLGGIIGSSYFLGIGDSILNLGVSTLYALILGGFIVWLVANAMGELCVALPRTGGFVSHARELVGRPWAAAVGWSYWVNWCAYVPSEMIAGGLILHMFFPAIGTMYWAILVGLVISYINLSDVKNFGKIESFLALMKIAAILFFCVMAALIWFGVIGSSPEAKGILGLQNVAGPEHDYSKLLPLGLIVIFQRMVMVLVNFQGTEIIALSAAETANPEHSIPLAIKSVSLRIIAAFVVPVALVLLILPHTEASIERSVFVTALERYGFGWASVFFSIVVLGAAVSCANSGLYGAIRALYSLSREGLAPAQFSRVNAHFVPSWATYVTVGLCWLFVPLFVFFEGSSLYQWLLAVSGFSGAICWISISWCQLRFRKQFLASGRKSSDLLYAAPGFPYLSYVAIWVQIASLAFVAFDADLRGCLYLGVPCVLGPMLWVYFWDKKQAKQQKLSEPEVSSKSA